MSDKKNKKNIPLHIVTPVLLTAVCAGIIAAAAVKPADKLKTYANIAFMGSLKLDPYDPSSDKTNGLVIKDSDIELDYSGKTSETGEPERPAFGELYAVVSTDALGINVPVYWGTTPELLEHGACQSSSSSVFGLKGNSVVSAHVDTFFADLSSVKEGDTVTVYTNYGKFTYKVKELIEFGSDNRKYITPTEDDRLTLYTCKRELLGASDRRIGAICELTKKAFYTEKEAD